MNCSTPRTKAPWQDWNEVHDGIELAPTPLPLLQFEQASEWDEVDGAFRLLYENYVRKGLISEHPSGLRFTHFNLLPQTASFVAMAKKRVIATFSLIVDSKQFGLPMAELYEDELDGLRRSGRKPAEISGLAIAPEYGPISIHLIMNLVKMMYQYSIKLGATDLVVACHPKHARLYKRLFLFEDIGGLRTYESVNDAPAVAVRLDLVGIDQRYRMTNEMRGFNLYRFFFSDEIFRCPPTALRVGAFPQSVNRKLCAMQPSVIAKLESGAPGLVRELTGWSPSQRARERSLRLPRADESLVPAMVPA